MMLRLVFINFIKRENPISSWKARYKNKGQLSKDGMLIISSQMEVASPRAISGRTFWSGALHAVFANGANVVFLKVKNLPKVHLMRNAQSAMRRGDHLSGKQSFFKASLNFPQSFPVFSSGSSFTRKPWQPVKPALEDNFSPEEFQLKCFQPARNVQQSPAVFVKN